MAIVGLKPRAGRRAAERYEQGLRAWRRTAVMKWVRLGSWAVLALAVVLGIVLPRPGAWFAGFYGGFFAALWLWLRETPPEYVDRWRRGAEGEVATAETLARLGAEWSAHHDLPAPYGNWDHVVVGPHAIFLLDSKNLGGTVSIQGRKLVVERTLVSDDYSRGLGRSAKWQAAEVNEEIARRTGLARWVQPVVVIWAKFPQRVVEMEGVTYVHGDHLETWLREQPRRMSTQGRDAICAALDDVARESDGLAAAS